MMTPGVPAEFSFLVTRADAWRTGRVLAVRRSITQYWLAFWFAPGLTLVFSHGGRIGSSEWFLSIAAMIVVIAICRIAFLWHSLGRRFPTPGTAIPGAVAVGPLGIAITEGSDTIFLGWPSLKEVKLRSGDLYFQTKSGTMTAIPRTAFPNTEAANQFRAAADMSRIAGVPAETVTALASGGQSWPPAPRMQG